MSQGLCDCFPSLWEGFFPVSWSLAAAKKCEPKVTFRLELRETWWVCYSKTVRETHSMTTVAWYSTMGGRERGGFTGGPNRKWIWLSSSSCQKASCYNITSPGLGAWEEWVSSGSGNWVLLGLPSGSGWKGGSWAGAAVWLYTEHSLGSH